MGGIWSRGISGLALATALVFGAGAGSGRALAADKVTLAIPVLSFSFAYAFVADAMGFWKDQGLDVDVATIAGLAATNALLNGDIQFSSPSGSTVLIAAAHNQKEIGIGVVQKGMPLELALRKDVADKTGLTVAGTDAVQRGKALKGLTIAVDGPGTILDGYLRHVAMASGVDPDHDMTITPVQPPAMNAAMDAKRIDGYVISPPWPEIAVANGAGVIWISAPRGDQPDLDPYLSNVIVARPDYCAQNASICTRFVAGVKKSMEYMWNEPDKAAALLTSKFKGMDPGVLKASFMIQRSSLQPDAKFTDAMWTNTQKFTVEAKMMGPGDAAKKFDGAVYTNAYTK